MYNKIKIIALFGESGSGKDTIQQFLVEKIPNSHNIISCTTRPKRDYEKHGKDYYFLSEKDFGEKVLNCSMLEATSFRNWMYGTAIDALDKNKINIGVFNIEGIECLLQDSRLSILPIYIKTDDKVRLMRSLTREDEPDCAEICRRFLSDKKDFSDIPFFSLIYKNNNNTYDFNRIVDLLSSTNFIN